MRKTLLFTILAVGLGLFIQNYFIPKPNSSTTKNTKQTFDQKNHKKLPNLQPTQAKIAKPVRLEKLPATPKGRNTKYPDLDESYAPFDADGNRLITQVVIQGKHLTFHGDLLIGETKDLEEIKRKKSLKVGKPRLWSGGKIPFIIDPDLDFPERVEDAILFFHTNSNIRFIERTEEKNYVVFLPGEMNCYSYVGQIGGRQPIYLSRQCQVRSIQHEIMHAIGFFHEQNRQDRDQYLQVLWPSIPEVHHMQFKKMPNDFMHLTGRPFDYQSIMLYPSNAFSDLQGEPSLLTKDGEFIPPSAQPPSNEDIIRINKLYPR